MNEKDGVIAEIRRAQKVKWMQGDEGVWKPKQGAKYEGGAN